MTRPGLTVSLFAAISEEGATSSPLCLHSHMAANSAFFNMKIDVGFWPIRKTWS